MTTQNPPVRSVVGRPAQTDIERISPAMRNYQTITETLNSDRGLLAAMFGGDKSVMQQFLAMAFSALASNPSLLIDAEPMSLVQAVKDAMALGLVPLTDDAGIAVYSGKAKLMPMWRGYVKRIRNSREVVDLDCQIVYQNDEFSLQLGTDPKLTHVPALPGASVEHPESTDAIDVNPDAADIGRGGYRGVYAWALMPSGKYIIEWMTVADINAVRDRFGNKTSRDGKPLPWSTSWGEMARKTVIRRLAKRLPAAAVDKLLAVEAENDRAQEETARVIASTRSELDEVRNLALRAVGRLPAQSQTALDSEAATDETSTAEASAPEPAEADAAAPSGLNAELPTAGVEETPSQPAQAAERALAPAVDPLVADAMKLAREQDAAKGRDDLGRYRR